MIGFAGPRVIKQTLGQRLPDGFQTAEFLQEHGFVDGIVRRENLKKTLYFLITTHRCSEGNYADFKKNIDFHFEPTEIVKERSFLTLPRTAWEKVKASGEWTDRQRPTIFPTFSIMWWRLTETVIMG